jgi:hypothetical protein
MQLQGLPWKWRQHQIILLHISEDFYDHCHVNLKPHCMNTFWMCTFVYLYTHVQIKSVCSLYTFMPLQLFWPNLAQLKRTLWGGFIHFKIMAWAFGAKTWNIQVLIPRFTGYMEFIGLRYSAVCSSVVGWGTMLQAGRSRGVPMRWIFFNLPNPSSHTMALGSTQPLTETSTRNIPGG